jgi:glucose-1-phosphate adenylyltransferase
MENTLVILLAGGAGERLYPLTRYTAKPGVPFGGAYRIIDFTLSNCINSDLRRIFILTQYKALELNRHIRDGWNILSPELGEYIEVLSPMKRIGEDWYQGTADAVYQNSQSIVGETPDLVLILSADHIYKMNYRQMMEWHLRQNADITLATIQVSPDEARHFGVCKIERDYRVTGFEEKPRHGNPQRSVFNPEMISASMGIYVFNTEVLMDELARDASDPNSEHDFGKNILPNCLNRARVIAYDFMDINAKAARYWRDVGTLDAYYEANMDLVSVSPEFNLYDQRWPIRTRVLQQPPAKFVFAQEGKRMGLALDSIVSSGCIISGGRVIHSVLSAGVRVHSFCEIERSILMPGVEVGRHSRVRNAILDTGTSLPAGSTVGMNAVDDREAGYVVTEGGITVVPGPSQELAKAAH